MLNEQIKNFRKEIISKMQLAQSDKDIATAMYLNDKINDLPLDKIKLVTDKLLDTLLIFYGIKEKDLQIYIDMRTALPKELKSYYQWFTLEEIRIGINGAIRGSFGDLKGVNYVVSLKMFRDLINIYSHCDARKNVINEYKQRKNESELTPHLSEAEKSRIVIESILFKFGKYKSNKEDSCIGARDYNSLLQHGITLPDFAEFLELAGQMVKGRKEFKNVGRSSKEVIISELIIRQFQNTAEVEAKRMALKKFYEELIASGKELEDFIKQN